jgi:uncharacterized phiE125 gp8 family phage protein
MNQLSVDRATLPAAMLDLAKTHLRVSHARDDALITSYLAMALATVERRCSINLNEATFDIDLHHLETTCCKPVPTHVRIALPVNNVDTFTVIDGGGADQSADYVVEQSDIDGTGTAYLVGPPITALDWTMLVDVGMPDADTMSPDVLAVVLRIVAAYYENRESSSPVFVDDFASELLSIWRPTV